MSVPVSECFALEEFYNGTNGDNWTSSTGWLVDPDVNTWFGVDTVMSGSVEHVERLAFLENTP